MSTTHAADVRLLVGLLTPRPAAKSNQSEARRMVAAAGGVSDPAAVGGVSDPAVNWLRPCYSGGIVH